MVNIQVDVKSVEQSVKWLNNIQRKQIPFATAKALTKTAQDVQDAMLANLPKKYTLRTGWYKKSNYYGFKVQAAKKSNLTAMVYTRAGWMADHEPGAVRTPRGKSFAIPTTAVKRTKRDRVPSRSKPRNLTNSFIKQTSRGPAIFQRYGGKRNPKIRPMYWLESKARIKPTLGFRQTAQGVVKAKFPNNFRKALTDALRTARK